MLIVKVVAANFTQKKSLRPHINILQIFVGNCSSKIISRKRARVSPIFNATFLIMFLIRYTERKSLKTPMNFL